MTDYQPTLDDARGAVALLSVAAASGLEAEGVMASGALFGESGAVAPPAFGEIVYLAAHLLSVARQSGMTLTEVAGAFITGWEDDLDLVSQTGGWLEHFLAQAIAYVQANAAAIDAAAVTLVHEGELLALELPEFTRPDEQEVAAVAAALDGYEERLRALDARVGQLGG